MVVTAQQQGTPVSTDTEALSTLLEERFDALFERKMAEREAARVPSLSMLVTRGTLDWAYPPFIIASTGAAMGYRVTMFFTFYGLGLLKKHLDLSMTPLGNPAMPMKMPFGPPWLRDVEWKLPTLVMSAVPGFQRLATGLMRSTLKQKGVARIEELRDACLEMEVDLIACQMTVDLFGWRREDFIDGIADWAGAATYLPIARDSDVSLVF
jgi:peroxiredoxin family protein